MSISIQAKTDTSYLFSSLTTSTSTANMGINDLSGILSDYSSIKNGSYGKLLKAYYGSTDNNSSATKLVSDKSASQDDMKTISKIQSSAAELKDSVTKLAEIEDEDADEMYKAVSGFVDKYNTMIKNAADSNNQSILSTAANMTTATASNEKLLQKVGVTINSDNTLSVDEKTFKESDMKTVNSLFGTTGSYAYGISTKASFIEMYAKNDAAKASGIYGQNATFASTNLSSGYNFYGYI